MDKLKEISYCGLYCGLCASRGRIPDRAEALREAMAKEGYEFWGKEIPGFEGFWEFLNRICDKEKSCPGCRQGGGPPFCGIRKCARAKDVEICARCDEFPCYRIESIGKGYPTLIADGKRLKEIGVDAWIAEQKKRAQTGFAYADIRCEPYEVPRE